MLPDIVVDVDHSLDVTEKRKLSPEFNVVVLAVIIEFEKTRLVRNGNDITVRKHKLPYEADEKKTK